MPDNDVSKQNAAEQSCPAASSLVYPPPTWAKQPGDRRLLPRAANGSGISPPHVSRRPHKKAALPVFSPFRQTIPPAREDVAKLHETGPKTALIAAPAARKIGTTRISLPR